MPAGPKLQEPGWNLKLERSASVRFQTMSRSDRINLNDASGHRSHMPTLTLNISSAFVTWKEEC